MDKMAVTGGAGFIGSNLAEHLLSQGHEVLLIDNFSTGRESNLKLWAERAGDRVKLLRADVNETEKLRHAFRGVLYVFHQAAIPSVPRSIEDPKGTESSNINGSLSVLLAARDAGVRRVVLASSSSVYGDDHNLPKVEERVGRPLSPYALSKSVGEQYCRLFYELYGLETVCLRYFNVFGPRQDPKSEYAAVIPRFILWGLSRRPLEIHGDGTQSRDFTYIDNVVEANILSAKAPAVPGEVFNVGRGRRVSLLEIVAKLEAIVGRRLERRHTPSRAGDVPHALADVAKAKRLLGYVPLVDFDEGVRRTVEHFRSSLKR